MVKSTEKKSIVMKENFILAIVAGPAILYLFRIIYSVSAGYDLMEPKKQLKSQTRNSDNLFEELINEWKSPTRKPLHQKHKQPRSALENLYQRAVPRESFIISSTRPSELLGHTNLVSWNVTYETVIKLASEGPCSCAKILLTQTVVVIGHTTFINSHSLEMRQSNLITNF